MPPYGGRAKALVEVDQVIGADAPDHGRMRAHIAHPFMPGQVAKFENRIREVAVRILESKLASPEPTFNVISDLAVETTIHVLSMFLGVDPQYHPTFRKATEDFIAGTSGIRPPPGFEQTSRELSDHLWALVELRRAEPRDDMITAIVQAQAKDPLFTDKDVMVMLLLLIMAGHETTTNLVGNSVRLFAKYPEQYEILRADEKAIPGAISEILRFESPVSMQVRMATRDTEISGTAIPQGSLVILGIGSSNLDAAIFRDPETFNVRRDTQKMMAFGFGVHFCAGAALARLEGRVVLEELIKRFPSLSVVETETDWHQSLIFRGPRKLHLRKPH
jgi:cytochrome P450 PksS